MATDSARILAKHRWYFFFFFGPTPASFSFIFGLFQTNMVLCVTDFFYFPYGLFLDP